MTPADDSNVPTSVTRNVPSTMQRVTSGRAYWVEACPGSDGAFYGASIKYTYYLGRLLAASKPTYMPTALDNGRRSPRKLLRAVVARLLGRRP